MIVNDCLYSNKEDHRSIDSLVGLTIVMKVKKGVGGSYT